MKTALVLSGGGARGAYEAGVICFLREELEPRLGRPLRFDIVCGTSVGAITACALVATAASPATQGQELVRLWSRVSVEGILEFGVSDLVRSVWVLGDGGLANPAGIRAVMCGINWRAIGHNIRNGLVEALSISATRVSNGRTALFVQQGPLSPPLWLDDPHFEMVKTRIGPRHALASSAIPVLFAPVEIDNQLYVDGGLSMTSPLSPTLKLGAERVAVISLHSEQMYPSASSEVAPGPTVTFLAGKAMNALLQDRLEQDVESLRRINAIVEAGNDSFGPQFTGLMNATLAARRSTPLRYVRNILARPSRDLGAIANRFAASREFRDRHRHRTISSRLLGLLAGRESEDSADLASYLLFDPGFAEELISLGRADARAHEDEWARFFDDTPVS